MKSLFLMLALTVSSSAFAGVKDLTCFGYEATRNELNRVTLEYNENTKKKEGYISVSDIGDEGLGGVFFTAEDAGIYTVLSIFVGSGESYPKAASVEVTNVEAKKLYVDFEKHDLTLVCF